MSNDPPERPAQPRARRTLFEVHHGLPDPARELNRLVGFGFRFGMTCLQPSASGDAHNACEALRFGLCQSGLKHTTASGFLAWSLAVLSDAKRPIVVLPITAAGFSRDECLAVSLVAACQHDTCPALRACAMALLGTDDPSRALAATGDLAMSLLVDNRRLEPANIATPEGLTASANAQQARLLAGLTPNDRPN
jgi:hypothetical protein